MDISQKIIRAKQDYDNVYIRGKRDVLSAKGNGENYIDGYIDGQKDPNTTLLKSVLGEHTNYAEYINALDNSHTNIVNGINDLSELHELDVEAKKSDTLGELVEKNIELLMQYGENRNQMGYDSGYDVGLTKGLKDGYEDGFNTGSEKGYALGLVDGGTQGYQSGYTEGETNGIEQGRLAEYDRFWDTYQNNGNRTNYGYAFAGRGWNDKIFKPKYPIYISNYCFYTMNQVSPYRNDTAVDFKNIILNGTATTTAHYLFANSNCKNITVDLSNCTGLTSTFILSGGGYLDNINIKVSNKLTTVKEAFNSAWTLKELRFMDGSEIACNGFDFQWSSSLTAESIRSIINALSSNTSGLSITLSLTAVKKAFETSSGANDGNISTEWLNLIATKSNWTINLV